jgi:hypothetical protein
MLVACVLKGKLGFAGQSNPGAIVVELGNVLDLLVVCRNVRE